MGHLNISFYRAMHFSAKRIVLCLVIVNVNVTKYMPQKCQQES